MPRIDRRTARLATAALAAATALGAVGFSPAAGATPAFRPTAPTPPMTTQYAAQGRIADSGRSRTGYDHRARSHWRTE